MLLAKNCWQSYQFFYFFIFLTNKSNKTIKNKRKIRKEQENIFGMNNSNAFAAIIIATHKAFMAEQ